MLVKANKSFIQIFFETLKSTLKHVFKRFEMLVKANQSFIQIFFETLKSTLNTYLNDLKCQLKRIKLYTIFFRNVKKYVSNKQRLLQKCPSAQQKYQKNQKYGQIFFKSCIQKCIRDVKQRSYIKFFNFRSKSCKPNSPL